MLGHVQPRVHCDSHSVFCKVAFQTYSPQHILVPGLVPPQVPGFTLLAELHEIPTDHLHSVKVPLDQPLLVQCCLEACWRYSGSTPWSKSLMYTLNRTGPSTVSRSTPLGTGLQLEKTLCFCSPVFWPSCSASFQSTSLSANPAPTSPPSL